MNCGVPETANVVDVDAVVGFVVAIGTAGNGAGVVATGILIVAAVGTAGVSGSMLISGRALSKAWCMHGFLDQVRKTQEGSQVPSQNSASDPTLGRAHGAPGVDLG